MPDNAGGREHVPIAVRLRRAALFVLFALVLLIPKTLALRRRRAWWNALRLVLALSGGLLLTGVRGDPSAWGGALVGLLLILLALLVPPAKEGKSVDEQARALGALVVLNGGQFRSAGEHSTEARLFVAPERVHVLDLQHRPLLEIPLGAVSSVRVEEAREAQEAEEAKEAKVAKVADPSTLRLRSGQASLGVTKEAKQAEEAQQANASTSFGARQAKEGWRLLIEWNGGLATFHYEGFFAEHLARIAETTVRGQLRRELAVLR